MKRSEDGWGTAAETEKKGERTGAGAKSSRAVFKTPLPPPAPWKRRVLTITAPTASFRSRLPRSRTISEMMVLFSSFSGVTSTLTQRAYAPHTRAAAASLHVRSRSTYSHVGTYDKKRNEGMTISPFFSRSLPSRVCLSEERRDIWDRRRRRRHARRGNGGKPRRRRGPRALASEPFSAQGRYALSEHLFSWLQLSHLAAIVCRSAQNSAPTVRPRHHQRRARVTVRERDEGEIHSSQCCTNSPPTQQFQTIKASELSGLGVNRVQ